MIKQMMRALWLASAVAAIPAAAQTAAQTAESAEPQTAEEGGVAEIVVTAQRKAERLQDVPIAITAITTDTLRRNDIRDLSRVEVLTPGFSFGRSGSDARPAIRGVRTENVAVSGDPTIGFFVDNVYRSRASMANEPFIDIARVEVQRGPQGTLYGRNTFGGNIAVASATPTDELGGGVNLIYGSFDRLSGEAYVNVPVTEGVALRVAGLRETMDGYVKGTTRDLDIFNRDTSYVRTSLKLNPSSNFEAVLRYSYWRDKGTGAGAFGYRVGGVFVNPTTNGFDIAGQPRALLYDLPRTGLPGSTGTPINADPLFYPGDTRLEQDLRQHALSLNMELDLGKVVARSITGYVDYEVFRNADNDFSLRAGNVDGQEDKLTSFSQEIQLASNDKGSRFDWLAGYFFFQEDVSASFFSSCPTAARNTAGCAFAAGLPKTTSHAVFGQASYWLIEDRLRLTGGVRYTHDSKDITRANATTDARQRLVTITPTGQAFTLNFEKVTWRANVDYKLSSNNLVYASVSTGFRSGGFNAGFFTNPLLPGGFDPETVTAYEVGSKNRFADGRVQLNLSAYRNEFRDLQVQNQFIIQTANGATTTSVILNAARAHSMGLEAELQWVPAEGLNIAMSGTLMEAKYDDYRNVPAPANYSGTLNYTGNQIPYSPNWKLTGLVSYDFDLGGSGKITPQATLVWSDGFFLTDTNTALDRQNSFAKLDLRLGWRSADDRYSIEGFVNNVTNRITLQRATFGSRGLNQSFDAPRMFGVRAGARF